MSEGLELLRFPVGRYRKPERLDLETITQLIKVIEDFPGKLRQETAKLNDEQLDTVYRKDGWSIRQVTNHCADSHMNSFTRLKLALTEDCPTIKPYDEAQWAELADSKAMGVEASLKILEGLHERWVFLLRSLDEAGLKKKFYHPEDKKEVQVMELIAIYAWHCRHHLAHITTLKKRMAWD